MADSANRSKWSRELVGNDLTLDDFVGNAEREAIGWAVADARRRAFEEAAEIARGFHDGPSERIAEAIEARAKEE